MNKKQSILIFFLLLIVAAMSASAQETVKKVRLYKGNTIVAEQNYDELDSIVFADVITPTPPAPTPANPNFTAKEFTVNSDGCQVYFSQGNLQYQASTKIWRFADNQYDAIGAANSAISSTNEGWIDLFGWGTSGYDNIDNDPFAVNYQPWSTSIDDNISEDYNVYGYGPSTNMPGKNLRGSSANYDWGVYNAISNGGCQAGMWRTLTTEEWNYVLNGRNLAVQKRAKATVCGVHGYVLLPDEFTIPEGKSWTWKNVLDWNQNVYDADDWTAMEANGAVFLPAAGNRGNTTVSEVGENGNYWTASFSGTPSGAEYMEFYVDPYSPEESIDPRLYEALDRYKGLSVRLVRPCPCSE